jgi:DNA mismatch repair protein MutS
MGSIKESRVTNCDVLESLSEILPEPKKKLGMFKEYMYYHKLCENMFDKFCILYQNGSFYEIFQPNYCDLVELSTVMSAKIAWKKTMKPEQPYNMGFPIVSRVKYINILLTKKYTVILIDQVGDVSKGIVLQRRPSIIYSPGVIPLLDVQDTYNNLDSNVILFVYIYQNGISVSSVDLQTGCIKVSQSSKLVDGAPDLSFVYTFINTINNISEVSFHISHSLLLESSKYDSTAGAVNSCKYSKEELLVYLDLITINSHYTIQKDNYKTYDFEPIFKQVYPKTITGITSVVEYMGLSNYPGICMLLVYTFNFVNKRNPHYLRHLEYPKIVYQKDRLLLSTNTVSQLYILPNKLNAQLHTISFNTRVESLYTLVNGYISTSIGRRALMSTLSAPFVKPTQIRYRHQITEYLRTKGLKDIKSNLEKIYDIVRLYRRISLCTCTFQDLSQFVESLEYIKNIVKIIGCDVQFDVDWANEMYMILDYITKTTKLGDDSVASASVAKEIDSVGKVGDSEKLLFFKSGIYKDLDDTKSKLDNFHKSLSQVSIYYSTMIDSEKNNNMIKIDYNENDSWHLYSTKIRAKILENEVGKKEYLEPLVSKSQDVLSFNYLKNTCKIKSSIISKLVNDNEDNLVEFNRLHDKYYTSLLEYIYEMCDPFFNRMVEYIELIDMSCANIQLITNFRYTRPNIMDSKSGGNVKVTGMRNPLGERISKVKWTSHDISLGTKDQCGILLYGVNASGKSMLLRSIGMCIILAQSGLYVPCDTMELNVYDKIVSQVDLNDNFLKGQSSFMVEIMGLRDILSTSDNKTLVLADELCKGTESTSGAALLGSLVYTLHERNTSFLITTHLHQLHNVDMVTKLENLRICHLSVSKSKEKDNVIFDRELKNGPSEVLYGLKIAEYMNLDKPFLSIAQGISDEISNTIDLSKTAHLDTIKKKSRYNSRKKTLHCEICLYKPTKNTSIPLDTHHINFQCTADSDNYIGKYHKNELHNLTTLCKMCHQKVHSGELNISGYKLTNNGIELVSQLGDLRN